MSGTLNVAPSLLSLHSYSEEDSSRVTPYMTLTPQTLKFNEEYSQPGIRFVERIDTAEFRKVQGHGGHSVSRIDVTTMENHLRGSPSLSMPYNISYPDLLLLGCLW